MPFIPVICKLCHKKIGEVYNEQNGEGNDATYKYCDECVSAHLQNHFPTAEEQKEGNSG